MSTRPTLILNKGADRRLRRGHLWVFSNEIDTARSPLKEIEAGELVDVCSSAGDYLGCGFANGATLISVRLLVTANDDKLPDEQLAEFLGRRLEQAFRLRESRFPDPYYRLVYAEGDGLPGLVVDRFADTLIVQITSAGMEQQRELIVQKLSEMTQCKNIHLANDLSARQLENLDSEAVTVLGSLPAELQIRENGCDFKVDASQGQKTGWFYDHRDNRALTTEFAKGKQVLDVFCYTGAWSIPMAVAGAIEVTAIDSSRQATERLLSNAVSNGVGERIKVSNEDAMDALKSLHQQERRFDLIVLDPPAFIKRKKDFAKGVQHYELLNRLACRVLADDGILVTASCSQAMPAEDLMEVTRRSAARQGKKLQVLHQLSQAPDHPWHAGVPETRYLKGFLTRLID